ncbi:dihydrofolate reductase [Cochlodiniinecator piscidefendens]|uniref:dihydrofolate reductase n=1 Tax=Cochlodiniinecator piscidefendens TaxID=2715756 RepID=UPI00140AE1C7|nr:dihydrofolate reductase [Cochlodiniinecator piscidefendens]
MITLIAARAHGGAIGKDNDIPWYAPEDLSFFKGETLGGAIIMGRNTWDSLPFKPLKNRMNLVVTSKGCDAEFQYSNLDDAVSAAYAAGYRRIYGVGGYQIYKSLLPKAHRLLLTEVDLQVDDADTYFPDFDGKEWDCIGSTPLRANDPRCDVFEYLRVA